MVGLGQDAAAFLDVVAVEADDQRLVRGVAEFGQRADDALGHGVTGGDAAEDVDEDGLDLLVAQDDVEAGSHDLGGRSTADVQEVGGLDVAVLFAGVGNNIQGGHHETGAVADDADFAVELDVVEVLGLGFRLKRVGLVLVFQLDVVRVAEAGVLVEGDLAVEGDDVAGAGQDQRVDLNEGGVFLLENVPELQDDGGDLAAQFLGEACSGDDFVGLGLVDADSRIDGDLGQRVRAFDGELFDFHAAFNRAHGKVVAVGPVQQDGEVVFLGDVGTLGDHHLVNGVALDVHAQDVGGVLQSLVGGLGDLDATGLTAASGLNLCLDDSYAADLLGSCLCFFRGVRHDAGKHGYTVRLEHIARLIFKQVHGLVSFYVEVVSVQPDPALSQLPGCGINAPCGRLGTSRVAQCSFGEL